MIARLAGRRASMSGVLTDDELTARTERALAASAAAGRELGLTVSEPRVLNDVFSVMVHLAPAPVAVRVPTVLPRWQTPDRQAAQQRRELAVAGWLAERGHPVVGPSPLVPAESVRRDGFSMTFWRLVEQVGETDPTDDRVVHLVARLHAAMRDYPGELTFLEPLRVFVSDGIAQLADRPDLLDAADLQRARREWALLEPVVSSREGFEAAFPGAGVQPIQGDAPNYNAIVTPDGELCSDFEQACLGPVEWDLALMDPDVQAAYDAEAAQSGGRPLDERVMRVMSAARLLQVVLCVTMADQLPMLVEGLRPSLEHWRTTPLAGGLQPGDQPSWK